mmetsp:Transcript_31481/g.48150  ORF Transcript_31481/g.48150 Transcript_31481/m.48150 type:complete len:201 (+) Transcript_31481:437-1039(+)
MCLFNKAVCLFKSSKFSEAIKIWNMIRIQKKREDTSDTEEYVVGEVSSVSQISKSKANSWMQSSNFPLSILFNTALALFLKGSYDKSLEYAQELIAGLCLEIGTYEHFSASARANTKELDFIGVKEFKEKIILLLKHLQNVVPDKEGVKSKIKTVKETQQATKPSADILVTGAGVETMLDRGSVLSKKFTEVEREEHSIF